jgi:hypothetical protein
VAFKAIPQGSIGQVRAGRIGCRSNPGPMTS